ncbi:hypothetical protein D3C84_883110 [compost metagenome]
MLPLMLKLPSARGSARVRMIPRSVPAWASVRHMEPAQRPSYIGGRYRSFKVSLAWASSARQAPELNAEYSAKLELAP